MKKVAVIGGGAAGCMAACAAAGNGAQVTVFERQDKCARKIYATGNGRCNLTNLCRKKEAYHTQADPECAERFHALWDGRASDAVMSFFESEGVLLHDRAGYVYPRTEKAETIAQALLKRMHRSGVQCVPDTRICAAVYEEKQFLLQTNAGRQPIDRLIIACGGKVSRAFGCTGDGTALAKGFGLSCVPEVPALVPLLTADPAIKAAKGVRTAAQVRIADACETGEVQFTETGISGIPVFQVSAAAARRLSNGKQTTAVINFLPEYNAEQALAIFRRHEQLCYEEPDATLHSLFDGIVPSGIASFLICRNGFSDEKKIRNLDDRERVCRKLLCGLLRTEIGITGTAGFERAQVTSGGVRLSQISENFEAFRRKGLFLAGEVLDLDGICGGYNLTLAMYSGMQAGRNAALT